MESLVEEVFELSSRIRYVALYQGGKLTTRMGEDLDNPSESDSDRFEELLVNPVLLLLTKQRGEIDCGGCEYLLIRYGHFYQYVRPVPGGHLSVCIQPEGSPFDVIEKIHLALSQQEA